MLATRVPPPLNAVVTVPPHGPPGLAAPCVQGAEAWGRCPFQGIPLPPGSNAGLVPQLLVRCGMGDLQLVNLRQMSQL